ncbi:response regulator [Lysinibacillus sp. 3P01SB]|uniref:response regulator n=1 Tax=Lysinibacillus sp. 3P01SB TaxID=3132284 RepID=UPI0039A4E5EF
MEKKIEVLIVEDDVRIAKIHEKFIASIEGFQTVGMAHTVEEAELWIESLQPQLILLDIYFPDKLGVELFEFVREKSPKTDIILITGAAEVDIVRQAYVNGVADYLLKPLTLQRFTECLVKYKAKKMIFESGDVLNVEDIKRLWNYPGEAELNGKSLDIPKGIDPVTKTKVVDFIRTCQVGITAEKLGKNLGISRTTARRYLEHLMEERLVHVEHIYGSVGRPERRYFIT